MQLRDPWLVCCMHVLHACMVVVHVWHAYVTCASPHATQWAAPFCMQAPMAPL